MKDTVCSCQNPDQAKVAQENGAAFVGGADLAQRILEDNVDFYVVVLDIISKLLPLKNNRRKEVPQEQERWATLPLSINQIYIVLFYI
ncbi:unnamed protein product, partial [Oncorhynchus mykiss]